MSRTTRINRPNSPTSRKQDTKMFWESTAPEGGKGRTYKASRPLLDWRKELKEFLHKDDESLVDEWLKAGH